MQAAPVEKTFCTTRDAAQLLGVSVGTIQLWVESGLLKAWKTAGGHRRVTRDSVDLLLHSKPAAPPGAAGAAAPLQEATAQTRRRMRILAVDDTPSLLRLHHATMALWALRPEVNTCDNAIAAFIQIGRSCPDLLVVDLQMPGMDGFALLRFLVELPEVRETTIVAVTALSASQIAKCGGLPPGIETLPKPIAYQRLQEIAEAIAERKQLDRQAP